MNEIEELKHEIACIESMANLNGLSLKGLRRLHEMRLELKRAMDSQEQEVEKAMDL